MNTKLNTAKEENAQQQQHSEEKNNDRLHFGGEGTSEMTFERFRVEGTPWQAIWDKERGWSAGIAEHKITDFYETEEELKKVLKGVHEDGSINWNLMFGFVDVIMQKVIDFQKFTEKQREREVKNG